MTTDIAPSAHSGETLYQFFDLLGENGISVTDQRPETYSDLSDLKTSLDRKDSRGASWVQISQEQPGEVLTRLHVTGPTDGSPLFIEVIAGGYQFEITSGKVVLINHSAEGNVVVIPSLANVGLFNRRRATLWVKVAKRALKPVVFDNSGDLNLTTTPGSR